MRFNGIDVVLSIKKRKKRVNDASMQVSKEEFYRVKGHRYRPIPTRLLAAVIMFTLKWDIASALKLL